MKLAAILASLCSMACSISQEMSLLVTFNTFGNDVDICAATSKAHALLTGGGLTFTYIFLWFRQYSFYHRTNYKHLSSNSIRVISSVTITLLLIHIVAYVAIMSTAEQLAASSKEAGCTYFGVVDHVIAFLRFTAAFNLSVTLTLFGLFMYPVVLSSGFRGCKINDDDRKETADVKRTLRISVFSVASCIVSDMLVIVVGNILASIEVPTFYTTSCYNLSLLINVISLICTYDRWKEILFGCCFRYGHAVVIE